jgi:hypothetical protein
MSAKSKYNIETLQEFCLQNELKLINMYDNVNRDTKIEGYCKTENCTRTYKKAFRMLNEHKNFYCHSCLTTIKNSKMKQTCLEKYGQVTNLLLEDTFIKSHSQETNNKRKNTNIEKYGTEIPSQNELVKQKMRKTTYDRFGVEFASQNETIKTKIVNSNKLNLEKTKIKIRNTNLKKYGVTCPSKNETIKQKMKNTNLQKYGFECSLQNKDVQNKGKQTNLLKYGVEYPSQNKDVKNRVKETCLERFGVEYSLQSEYVKNKGKQTNLQKYGYEHYQHNKIASENASKNAYKLKKFITPSGKEIICQGYEPFALEYLIHCINTEEENIITNRKDVPDIWYNDLDGKKHRHYVDIFIPTENLCIEVKSSWTFKKKQDIIFLKQSAGKELGYNYEIWIYDEFGNCIEQYT